MPVNTPAPSNPKPASGDKPMNVWMIVSAVLAIALIIATISATKGGGNDSNFNPISSDEAGNVLINFVNEIYGGQIGQSTLKSVTEKNGLYKIIVNVDNAGQSVEQTVFMTKDGKLFIPQALDMADVSNQYQDFLNSGQAAPGVIAPPVSAPIVEDVPDPIDEEPADTSDDE